MKTITVILSEKAHKEIKRLSQLDDRSMKSWFRLYCERAFASQSLPDVPAKRQEYFPPLTFPGIQTTPAPFEVGDPPWKPEITCGVQQQGPAV